ncbi:hypothetical protein [Bailinhaonella thermotolerans]|uniref:Uncharacterized protein n=1 Tax=Bailinhaonella thermotolerans TaxID=1070861 RepID=A0A3A4AX42_9ACTN|nr:hypothetical protein [Bailinhaonella thermotolerans]RJL24002.1 hypothetical protein D5H75_31745 [Bailinhaonella thermotolerans]
MAAFRRSPLRNATGQPQALAFSEGTVHIPQDVPAGFTREERVPIGRLVFPGGARAGVDAVELGPALGLPRPQAGGLTLVSRFVAEASPRRDLVYRDRLVRDESGHATAARALARPGERVRRPAPIPAGEVEIHLDQLVNLTPHDVVVHSPDGARHVLPPGGTPPRCRERRRVISALPVPGGWTMPVYEVDFGEAENLPERRPGVWYIVNRFVAEASGRPDLVYPDGLIQDGTGMITGCHTLALAA